MQTLMSPTGPFIFFIFAVLVVSMVAAGMILHKVTMLREAEEEANGKFTVNEPIGEKDSQLHALMTGGGKLQSSPSSESFPILVIATWLCRCMTL